MKDKYVVEWIYDTLGFGWFGEKKYNNKLKYKKQWRWSCGYQDALIFAKLIWPHIQVKVHGIEKIIDHYDVPKPDRKNIIDLQSYREEHGR